MVPDVVIGWVLLSEAVNVVETVCECNVLVGRTFRVNVRDCSTVQELVCGGLKNDNF